LALISEIIIDPIPTKLPYNILPKPVIIHGLIIWRVKTLFVGINENSSLLVFLIIIVLLNNKMEKLLA
jgi:hypothetical protein